MKRIEFQFIPANEICRARSLQHETELTLGNHFLQRIGGWPGLRRRVTASGIIMDSESATLPLDTTATGTTSANHRVFQE